MNNEEEKKTFLVQRVNQSNKLTKSLLNFSILSGSLGFLIVSMSSYLNKNFINILDAHKIIFYPQGLTMMIYGCLGLILSINQILILQLGIGEGFNEFNKKTKMFKIVRKNSYSKNLELIYSIDDIVRGINIKIKI
jgi:hypothetical protein